MKLFLFANFFPYKRSEPFLITEFEFARKYFSEISVFTLYGKTSEITCQYDNNVTLLKPVFETATDKKSIFLKGFFNSAPCGFHLKELFSSTILFSFKKLYWFFISLFITRATLSSESYKQLIRQINTIEKGVLYFYWGDNLAWTIPYLKKKISGRNFKIVLRLHGSDLYEYTKGNYAPLRNQIFSDVDEIYTVSENGKNYLDKLYPQFATKIFVSRLGVADHGLNPIKADKIFKIISVSNVVPLKRIHLIFEALQRLDINVEWHHYGDGPLFTKIKELAATSKKNIQVCLHGFVSNNSLMEEYKTKPFDLFVNVSSSEGLPVSIMEALSFGIPVIATDVGGTSELVDASTGSLLSKDILPDALSAKLAWFFNLSSEERDVMRINARKRFEEKVNAAHNYEQFYNSLLKKDS